MRRATEISQQKKSQGILPPEIAETAWLGWGLDMSSSKSVNCGWHAKNRDFFERRL